jgi:hypothetical protein
VIAGTALAVAGCGGGTTPSDPYELIVQSTKTGWSPVQVNVGMTATASGDSVTFDPADLAIVIDTAAGKGAFHLSLPVAGLRIPASALAELGVTGDSIDLDIVEDGQALYAKSPLFRPMIQMLMGRAGNVPAGDLAGWLKLGTNAELVAFAAMAGGAVPAPSASAPADNAASLKSYLDGAGVTLTLAGTEKHGGVDAQHVKVAIDSAKLAANPNVRMGARAGAGGADIDAMMKELSLSGDLWIDGGSKHIVEIDVHISQTSGGSATAEMAVTAHDPDGSVSLDAPSSSVDVPLQPLVSRVLEMMSGTISS